MIARIAWTSLTEACRCLSFVKVPIPIVSCDYLLTGHAFGNNQQCLLAELDKILHFPFAFHMVMV